VSGSGESIGPVGGRHGSLEEEGASDIVGTANHALSFSVLLRSIGAGHAKGNTFVEKEGARGGVVKLTTVVTLQGLAGAAELSRHMSEKIGDCWKSIRL